MGAKPWLRRIGEVVTQQAEIEAQPDKETGVDSYCGGYVNDKVHECTSLLYVPDSVTGESYGRRYFIPKLVLNSADSCRC